MNNTMKCNHRSRMRRHTGFTMMELMVSVAVLSIIILAFGEILNSSKNVISISQARMRADNIAGALADTIRADLRRCSKMGFLKVGSGELVFTQVGQQVSMAPSSGTTAGTANASVCGYKEQGGSLYRLNKLYALGQSGADILSKDFATIQSSSDISNEISAEKIFPSSLKVNTPPEDISDIENSWMLLSAHVKDLKFEAIGGGSSPFTKDNQINWPAAIKVSFTVNDPLLEEAFKDDPEFDKGLKYEIICPIGS